MNKRIETPEPPAREITPESVYRERREFLNSAALVAGTATVFGGGLLGLMKIGPTSIDAPEAVPSPPTGGGGLSTITKNTAYDPGEPETPFASVTTYNNYYEFGVDKGDPARNAYTLRPRPWTVAVEGECAKPQVIDIEKILRWAPLEERVYRMRCVEAWSMVIPWVGFPLAELIRRLEPTSRAKYIAFETLYDPAQMSGQKGSALPWPYIEGLRLDEARNPLALLAVGLYGQALPNQNGAPLRLVVPWKYGFKGIKSIVRMSFTAEEPPTTWNRAAPGEYGFYANVNPGVPHPRWSQSSERRIGEFVRRETLPFNGYAADVAGLYSGMDLARWF